MIREKTVSNIILVFEKIEKLGEKWWGVFILMALPVFLLMFPFLFSFRTFTDGFSYVWPQQFFYFYKYSIASGDSGLWNPLVFSGFPQFISLTGGFFSPVVYLFLNLFSAGFAYHFLIFLHVILAGFFTAVFLKKIGVSVTGAYLGALAFIFNQWFLVSDLTFASALPYLPLLFLLVLKIREKKKLLLFLVGVSAVALGWFSAHWHYFIEILFTVGLFALFLDIKDWKQKHEGQPEAKKKISFCDFSGSFRYIFVVFVGTLIGCIQLIPTLLYSALSARGAGFSAFEAARGGLWPGDLITFFLPHTNFPTLNSWPWIFYVGALQLFFFLYGFRLKKRDFGFRMFFSCLVILASLLVIERSPLFWLFVHIPFLNLLHGPHRWILIISFAMSVIAGMGFDSFVLAPKERRGRGILAVLTAIFAAVFTGVFLYSFLIFWNEGALLGFLKNIFRSYFYQGKSLPIEHYYGYLEKLFNYAKQSFYLPNPKVFVPLFFGAASLFVLHWAARRERLGAGFRGLVGVFVFLNAVFVFYFSTLDTPSAIIDHEPVTAVFLKQKQEGKILPVFTKENAERYFSATLSNADIRNQSLIFSEEFLLPNYNVRYLIKSADYLDEFMSKRMARALALLRDSPRDEGIGRLSLAATKNTEVKKELFISRIGIAGFLGIRYFISSQLLPETPSLKKIYEEKITDFDISLYIYENNEVRPLFYFADSVKTTPEDEIGALTELSRFEFKHGNVFVECPKSSEVEPPRGGSTSCKFPLVDGKGIIEIKTKKNTVSILKIKTESPEFLVFSENHLPGWRAYVDGNETPIYTVGSVYIGIGVPAGEHEVKFRFEYSAILKEFVKLVWKKFNFFDEFR